MVDPKVESYHDNNDKGKDIFCKKNPARNSHRTDHPDMCNRNGKIPPKGQTTMQRIQ